MGAPASTATAPSARVLLAMPVMLLGLALALDVFGAASGLGAAGQWSRIGAGVAFALAAAATFGLALVFTQHEAGDLDGRLRTATTMAHGGAARAGRRGGAGRLPPAATPPPAGGAWSALTLLYGTGFTIMFTVLPRLGVVGNSAIMNVEPIFALVLAWAVLGQSIAPSQVAGGAGRGGDGDVAGPAPALIRPRAAARRACSGRRRTATSCRR